MTSEKHFISANELTADAFKLAEKVYNEGFLPTLILGVLRGGASISLGVHEFFCYLGVHTRYRAIQTTSYTGINQQNADILLFGLEQVEDEIQPNEKILIVDDVFDTGRSIDAILSRLNTVDSQRVRTATLWFKPENNLTHRIPDFHLHETDQWIVFPHELEGLSLEELSESKPEAANAIKRLQP